MHKIYLITNNITNKHYVGYTSNDVEERLIGHLSAARTGSNYLIHQSIRKYGWENFSIKTLYESWDGEHTLKEMEPYFVKEYESFGSGYNMTLGGEGTGPCSPETAKKISLAKKGEKRTLTQNLANAERGKQYVWITDGATNIRIHKDFLIPEGFHRGRTQSGHKRINGTKRPKFVNGYKKSTKLRKPRTQEHKNKIKLSQANGGHVKGRIWINNGTLNKRIKVDDEIPSGFIKGRKQ